MFSAFLLFLQHILCHGTTLIPHRCARVAHRLIPLFRRFYCRFHGKRSQAETSFKTHFLSIKGENSVTLHCVEIQTSENMMAGQGHDSFPQALESFVIDNN